MAHVFPAASLIYPDSPQSVPQEFLIFQLPEASKPKAVTAWSIDFPQLLRIPLLYDDQLLASTQTETGR